MNERIPLVDPVLSKEELKRYDLREHEIQMEIEGVKFSLCVMDFSENGKKDEKQEPPPLALYFMGFGEGDITEPNDLSAHIIERAKKQRQILIVPRFPQLNQLDKPYSEASITLKGMEELNQKEKLPLDLARQDIEIFGFSNGGRNSIEAAGAINSIAPNGKEGKQPKRVLHQISPTCVIDVFDPQKSDRLKGIEFTSGFVKQVTWITLEETRLRLNAQITRERARFNKDIHRKMESGEITRGEREFSQISAEESKAKDPDGTYKYPLIAKGLEEIPAPKKAFDQVSAVKTAQSIAQLFSYPEGRAIFNDQLNASKEENIVFLKQVIERAMSGSPLSTGQGLSEKSLWQAAKETATAFGPVLEHFAKAEMRDPVCDGLETFNIKAHLPIEDVIFPNESFGRTVAEQIRKFGVRYNVSAYTEDGIRNALKKGDIQLAGRMLINHPEELGYLLFPRAKSLEISFEGEYGSLSGGHLAPLKSPAEYIK